MADEENEYERLVALINDIESTAQKTDVSYIDVSDIINKTQYAGAGDYRRILDVITEVETGRRPQKESQQIPQPVPIQQKQAKQKSQKQKPDQTKIISGVAQAQFTQSNVAPVKQEKRRGLFAPAQKVLTPAETMQRRKESAGEELKEIAGKLGSIAPKIEFKKQKINVKDLVLPNLSIADQIAELERIIEGLQEHVFDVEHLAVVNQELLGLQQVASKAKKSKRDSHALEQSLIELRDQRIAEALALMQQSGVG